MIESDPKDNLSWLAFRYVANELHETKVREFESLLMTDQAAREAVARAVEETSRIRVALADAVVATAGSRQSHWRRQTTRVAVVAVGSCLALLLLLCLIRSSMPISAGVAQHVAAVESWDSPAELAYAWAETRRGLAELQPEATIAPTDALDSLLNGSLDWEADEPLGAPSWMLAALANVNGGIDSESASQE